MSIRQPTYSELSMRQSMERMAEAEAAHHRAMYEKYATPEEKRARAEQEAKWAEWFATTPPGSSEDAL